MGQEEYKELSSFLRRFVRRVKIFKEAEVLCLAGICLLLLFSLGLGIQEIKIFLPYAPMAYSILTISLVVLLIGWFLFQGFRRISQEWAAHYIEEKCPHLRNNLINSLQLYPTVAGEKRPREISTSMVLALLRATRKQLNDLRIEELVNTKPVKVKLGFLGILFAPVLAIVLFHPPLVGETFSLITHPLKDLPPYETLIDVTTKDIRVARGSQVTIHAMASGAIPKSMELVLWTEEKSKQKSPPKEKPLQKLQMEGTETGKFSAIVQDLQESLQYRVATGPFSSPAYTIEAIDPPQIGNLKITLYPPYYTGLQKRIIEGGNIEGIKGSTVTLEAISTKKISKAKILLGKGREVQLKTDGRKLHGKLVLLQPEKYQIMAEDRFGFSNDPIAYDIRLRPDGFPTVEILRPAEDLEISGDETIPLDFRARDDFGIQEVTLAFNVNGREERLSIQKDENKKFIFRERFNWDLGKLGLREGEEVIYHLEVKDNDTISGPKIGSSRSLTLRLKNFKAEHKQVGEMIRDLSENMVDLLGDHLETPFSEEKETISHEESSDEKFEQKLDKIIKSVEEVMRRTEKDRLTDFATWSDLEALRRNLRFTKDELLTRKNQALSPDEKEALHDEISSELERMSLLSEEISKRLKAQEVASAAQDLMRSQERLLDSLDKLQSGDKKLDEILKEISNLSKLLASLQQALSKFASRLPDEFVNNDAIRGLSFRDMFSALEEIRKKLLEGDIEGAMRLAREFFNQLASMVAALQNAQQSAMSSSMGRIQGEMMRSTSELQEITREQREILLETEEIKKKALEESGNALKKKIEQFQNQAQKELSRLAELFPDEESEREGGRGEYIDSATMHNLLKHMIGQLRKKDYSAISKVMEMAQKELEKGHPPGQEEEALEDTEDAETSLEELMTYLKDLLVKPEADLTDQEIVRLSDLAKRQDTLKERTEDLHEKLSALFQLFPSLDPKITKNIQEAGVSMGTARTRLSDSDAEGAIPPEQDALDRLTQSQEQMRNSMAQLAQRGQLGHMPVTFLFRRGRFLPSGRLVPLPGMAQLPQFDIDGGQTGLDTEKFKLPGKEDYKVPRSYREEILESLKQGVPPGLKEQIESYFKNLSE